MSYRRYYLLVPALIALLLFIAAGPYLEWLWFDNLGLGTVFWTMLLSRWGVRICFWLFFFLFLLLNLFCLCRSLPDPGNVVFTDQFNSMLNPGFVHSRKALWSGILGSAILTGFLTAHMGGYWLTVQQFFHAVPFGVSDPLFGRDIGEYIFRLPFFLIVNGYLQMVVVVTALILLGLYLFLSAARFDLRQLLGSFPGLRHVSVLLAVFFLLKAWDYRLQMYQLLYSTRGVALGAGYADVHAQLPALGIMTILAVVVAVVLMVNLFWRRRGLLVGAIGALLISSLLLGRVYPALIQQFRVSPNEYSRERPYIEHNIEFTRRAYALDKIDRRDYPGDTELTAADLAATPGTIDNVRLWDYRPLQQTYQQLQSMRPHYRFVGVDTDRYHIDGQYRQVMLAAREMDQTNLAEQARTWVNQRLKFTHGYGLVMNRVNEVTTERLPNFIIENIPPKTETDLIVNRPEIYYGELTDQYVIVNTGEEEYDYPLGETNATTIYEGTGGIPIGSFLRRAAFAFRLGDYRLLLSGDITSESRIMLYRNIAERVQRAAPFLQYDEDPYLVLNDGRLFWIVDAYTRTNMYPYSQPFDGSQNYIRNAVKVVVDAYNGSISYYICDPDDPLIQSYDSIFPELFEPITEMPASLVKHMRYPERIFAIQANMLATYQMQDPEVFYNREDQWQIPTEQYAGISQPLEPYYTIIQLPGEEREEFVLMLPYNPRQRNNMVAWLAARNDGDNYGKTLLYTFPKGSLLMGPSQIENRIDQSTEISQLLTLWDQRGSHVIRGNLLVLPVKGGIIYVEPVFIQADEGGLPELARVIVAYKDHLIMEESLESALGALFGTEEPTEPLPPAPGIGRSIGELIQEANRLFQEAQRRSQSGDWAGYGQLLSELEGVLGELAEVAETDDGAVTDQDEVRNNID